MNPKKILIAAGGAALLGNVISATSFKPVSKITVKVSDLSSLPVNEYSRSIVNNRVRAAIQNYIDNPATVIEKIYYGVEIVENEDGIPYFHIAINPPEVQALCELI